MILEDVLEQAAYARPGYALAAFKEAALPVYVITAKVIILEKKPLSPIEEGCLRAIEAGLCHPEDICKFLGLSAQIVKTILASLNSGEQINYTRPQGKERAQVNLTDKGRYILSQSKMIEPEERLVRFTFDPLLKKVVFIPTSGLYKPKDVKEAGWLEIPLCGIKRPEAEDIPLSDIDKAIQRIPRSMDEMRELLAVRRIERRELQFTRAVALYYRSNANKEVQVGFYREEGFSVQHETTFAELGGPDLIGARHVLQVAAIPLLESGLTEEEIAKNLNEVDTLERTIAAASEATPDNESPEPSNVANADSQKKAEDAIRRLKAMTQRPVRCHEHPILLRDALVNTKERLLIISPWIKYQVMDDAFIRSLEALLRNGVDIYIGYGIEKEDGAKENERVRKKVNISPTAKKNLDRLKIRFNNLTLKFVGNTHRKMLVSDNRFAVVTSFNWLSFKGDPKEPPRDELGILISESTMLEDIFNDGLKLINDGYDHPEDKVGERKIAHTQTQPPSH